MEINKNYRAQNPSDSRLRVLIVGAGLAGLAAAALLREDHDVVILESSTDNSEIGAAITLSANGTRVLRRSLSRAGFSREMAGYVEAKLFTEQDTTNLSILVKKDIATIENIYGEPWWYFSRYDLHSELKRVALSPDGLGNPAQLRLGAKVVEVNLAQNTVLCANRDSYDADVIIGADGIRSVSAAAIHGETTPVPSGFSAYRCLIPSHVVANDPETAHFTDTPKVMMLIGSDHRIVLYPCSSGTSINLVCIFPDTDARLQNSQWRTSAPVFDIVDEFKGFHPSVSKMLGYATHTGVWQLRDKDPLDRLVSGRLVLVGDAAHAMLPHQGQGACQAIEDAEALRILLHAAERADVDARLQIFERLRLERISTIQRNSRALGPKLASNNTVAAHVSTQSMSDYNWRYDITKDAIGMLAEAGGPYVAADEDTGELRWTQ